MHESDPGAAVRLDELVDDARQCLVSSTKPYERNVTWLDLRRIK
jgi:hypothetical protein